MIRRRASETGIEDLRGESESGVAFGRRLANRPPAVV